MIVLLTWLQAAALLLLIARLLPGRKRRPPVRPRVEGDASTSVSVIVPTYNEARRLAPCLEGLMRQGQPLREIIVVDSGSSDGTPELIRDAMRRDSRVRLTSDPPLPAGWVGKVWALQHGLSIAGGEWILGVDADTEAQPGMVAGVVAAAREEGYDVASFSPRFDGMTGPEQWLQPSMLLTLVYRFGAAGRALPPAERVMANGQCFLARRLVLLHHGGYEPARASWADDVTLARSLARAGVRVGFLDGSHLYDVRAYESVGQMWREWGRSFDLSDATSPLRQWLDVAFIALVQGIPWVMLPLALAGAVPLSSLGVSINVAVVSIRVLMLLAIRGSYRRRSIGFWLSPLADPVATVRLVLSTLRRPTQWRGRAPVTLSAAR